MPFWRRKVEERTQISISDPAIAAYFGVAPGYAGVSITESTAVTLSAVWRSVSLISGTIAGLPMRTIREVDGVKTRVSSFLDNPGGPDGPTAFEWKETVLVHLLLHGNAFLAHVFNGAGAIAALVPVHPSCVSIEYSANVPGLKIFTATLADGTRRQFDGNTMTHIPGLSTDGLRGLSPISVARNSLGTSVAADRSAAKMFSDGALISGVITPEDDLTEDEAKAIKAGLDSRVAGWENASSIAVINRKLKFSPFSMSAEDAQFLESRAFQVQEVARWFGVPANLLMDPGAVSTWGTGVEIQNRGLARYTLAGYTSRIEERLSRLLPAPRKVEFDYAGLLQPAPEQEIPLLIQQVESGLLTLNEARALRNLPPVPGGDSVPAQPAPVEVPL